jgi:hypothetical protein
VDQRSPLLIIPHRDQVPPVPEEPGDRALPRGDPPRQPHQQKLPGHLSLWCGREGLDSSGFLGGVTTGTKREGHPSAGRWLRHQDGSRAAGAHRREHHDDLHPCLEPRREGSPKPCGRTRHQPPAIAAITELCRSAFAGKDRHPEP